MASKYNVVRSLFLLTAVESRILTQSPHLQVLFSAAHLVGKSKRLTDTLFRTDLIFLFLLKFIVVINFHNFLNHFQHFNVI